MADSEQGFGKKILSFFIKESTEPVQPATTPDKPTEAAPKPMAVSVPNVAGTADIDRKFVDHFVDLLEKANLPGPDYFEYKQALQNMEGLGLGKEKQFQAAWASFKAMGSTQDTTVLTTSAEQYLGILEKDRAAFLKDVEKAISDRVGALQQEHKKLEEHNQVLAREMAAVQKKLEDNKNRLGQISGEITEQSARINANRERFEITYRSFVEQIKTDLSQINQYLKST